MRCFMIRKSAKADEPTYESTSLATTTVEPGRNLESPISSLSFERRGVLTFVRLGVMFHLAGFGKDQTKP